ncbi:MAG: hypothetical protein KatS3mg105_2423 [Gemmatales bacterium]|nr:MAG: hypothetical protein KatS3mg105_2423 [Gemmatales bacterium]
MSENVPTNPLRRCIDAWNRFWFSPADPTLLGFLRICTGLIVFYIHFAYTFDLEAMIGPDGWVNAQMLDRFRSEVPWNPRSWTAWDEVKEREQLRKQWLEEVYPNLSDEEKRAVNGFRNRWEGLVPHLAYSQGFYATSIWYFVQDPQAIWVVHIGILILMFLFTIGFCTRLTAVLTWLAALSYLQRSPTVLFGMDTMTNFMLLYLAIGPSGAALSVDRLIQRYWRTWSILRLQRKASEESSTKLTVLPLSNRPRPSVSANLALRLIQINVCFVYFVAGLSKLQGTSWWNGTAIWGTMANPEFSPVHNHLFLNFMYFLVDHPWVWYLFMAGGVVFTLVFEIGFPTFIWLPPLRWTMIVSSIVLHTGIAAFMGLTTFSLIMVTAVLAFLPQEALHRLLEKLGRGSGLFRLRFSTRERRHVRTASLIHAVDPWKQIRLVPDAHETDFDGTAKHHLELVDDNGTIYRGYALFERICRSLRLLWPLALLTWCPGVGSLGRKLFPETPEPEPQLSPR